MRATVTRAIGAPPDMVYRRIVALDEVPNRSPEPQRFEWTGGRPGEVGASFRGWNKMFGLTWWTNGWITAADAPRTFTFETSSIYGDRQERTNRWNYSLAPQGEGTVVTESLETIRLPVHLRVWAASGSSPPADHVGDGGDARRAGPGV